MTGDLYGLVVSSVGVFIAATVIVYFGWPNLAILLRHQEARFDRVLNGQLLMNTNARAAMILTGLLIFVTGLIGWMLSGTWIGFVLSAVAAIMLPNIILNHLEIKRRQKLETQILDGITSLASGVRAGLTLVQSMQLLVRNAVGPIRQEFEQLLREYELGVDLSQAMLNASNRIGSSHYRLLFAAIQAHRDRGGDVAQSLDRINEAIREIQRLEGKLSALTAQGRNQAVMMAVMAIVIMVMGFAIAPEEMNNVLQQPKGRLILLIALGLVVTGFLWIRRIMAVDL